MKKILWPRFGAGGTDAGRYMEASGWPMGVVGAFFIMRWAMSVARNDDAQASIEGVLAITFLLMIPIVGLGKSRSVLAGLLAAQATATICLALVDELGWALASAGLALYVANLLRAALRFHRDAKTAFAVSVAEA